MNPCEIDWRALADAANAVFKVWGYPLVALLALGAICKWPPWRKGAS